MKSFIDQIFSPQKPLSRTKIDQIKSVHFVARNKRQNRLNLVLLILSLVAISSIGLLIKQASFHPKILGIQSDSAASAASTPTKDPVAKYCLQQGGKLDTSSNPSACRLLDGSFCLAQIWYQTGVCKQSLTTYQVPSSTSTKTPPSPNPTIPPTTHIYLLSITQNPDAPLPIESGLADYLNVSLNLPHPSHITKIIYNVDRGSPYDKDAKFNFSYYLTASASLPLGTHQDYATTLNLQPVDPSLASYLANPDYCQIDQDCIIRENFCTSGAFNRYQPYLDSYVCRSKIDEYGNNLIVYDEAQSCKAKRVFDGPQCQNHTCIPTQEALLCI